MPKVQTVRFNPNVKPDFCLPPRCPPLQRPAQPRPGFHTYYVSADARGIAPYLPHCAMCRSRGFRHALLGPAGFVFDPPTTVLLGVQDGNTFDHAVAWATSTPITELADAFLRRAQPATTKDQGKAQSRFLDAQATLEALAEQQAEAEAELDAAILQLIELQGVDTLHIDGGYYDVTYSREKVYLKKRDPRFHPSEDRPEPKKPGKTTKKRTRRDAA